MHQDGSLRIVSIDAETLAVAVRCGDIDGFDIPMRLANLLMIAADCGVRSVTIECNRRIAQPVRTAVEELAARNPLVAIVPGIDASPGDESVIGAAPGFVCARGASNAFRFDIGAADVPLNAERASRFAYILSSELGFTSAAAFDIYLGTAELLRDAAARVRGPHPRIDLRLEAAGEGVRLSAADRADGPAGALSIGETLLKVIVPRGASCGEICSGACFDAGEPEPLDDGSRRISLAGHLDTAGAFVMEDLLSRFVQEGTNLVRLDFASVKFISSAGLGILIGMVSALREVGGDVVFERVQPKVRSIFRLLNLEEYFTIAEQIEAGAERT